MTSSNFASLQTTLNISGTRSTAVTAAVSIQSRTTQGVSMSKPSSNRIHSVELTLDTNQERVSPDGIDRRGFLKCMAWAGTGLIWTISGGIPVSEAFAGNPSGGSGKPGDFSFVQISDSHIGFNKPANPD